MRGKIIQLKQLSGGAPEQWEGKLETGQHIYAREKYGEVRVEIDDIVVYETKSNYVLDVLQGMFDIDERVLHECF